MIKRICILTKSYKHGGYCVAGIDIDNKNWIRLVNSDDPNTDEIRKEQMFINQKPIECFDVIECDFIKQITINCQTENWLLNQNYNFKYIKSLSLNELSYLLKIENGDFFILNENNALSTIQAAQMNRSLFFYQVQNLKIEISFYSYLDEFQYRYKCSFDYNDKHYSDISITDPIYRDPNQRNVYIENAFIVASLPSIPYKDNLYYKFVAKVIPIEKELSDYIFKTNKHTDISPFVKHNLVVRTQQTPGTVMFENYNQLKAEIDSGVAYYKKFEYTLDTFNIAQKHHKELKFVKNVLEKTKREIVNAYNQPLNIVVNRLDELINMIKEPFKKVDNFIKINEKEAKKQDIYYYARDMVISYGLQEHLNSILNSPAFFNDRWLLKSCEANEWRMAIKFKMHKAATDIKNILSLEDNKRANAMAYYYQTLSMDKVKQFLNSIKKVSDISMNENNEIKSTNNLPISNIKSNTQNAHCSANENNLSDIKQSSQPVNDIDLSALSDSKILNIVANSLNPYTGKVINGIDNNLKRKLMDISIKLETLE